jgi:chromosome segregation ATPase
MRRMTINWWSLGSVLCAIVLVAGCETTGQHAQAKKATRAVTSMEKTRSELVKADQQVDEAMVALDRLTSTSVALPDAYKVYTAQVSEASKQSQEAQQRADRMREDWRDYITAWETEVDTVSTPELQASATERREKVRENYDRLRDAARATDAAYQPFLNQLRDIQATLSLDLTPAGIEAAKPAIDAARQSAQNLKQQIGAFVQEIDQVAAATTGRAPVASTAPRTE